MKAVNDLIEYCKTQELNKRLVFLINSWVNKNVTYKKEDENRDYWQTPSETINLMTGDCEDIAVLKAYILLQLDDIEQDDLMFFHLTEENQSHLVLNCLDIGVLDNKTDKLERGIAEINFFFNLEKIFKGEKSHPINIRKFENARQELLKMTKDNK